MNREAIAEAILAQIRRLNEPPYDLAIPSITRDWKPWTEVTDQPYICPVVVSEAPTYARGLPIKWTATYDLWIYARKDADILGVTGLNRILDAVETIFAPAAVNAPPNEYVNTLGGLVHRCALAGPTDIEGGYLGDQAIALMTLEVVTAP